MFRFLSISLIVLVMALPLAGWWAAQRSLPPMSGVVSLSELKDPVIVKFDARAVPYLQATYQDDLYMAQGYLAARDRMFQMDILRRTALGQLSEVFGISSLPTDKLMRTIGFNRIAREELTHLSPAVAHGLDAYTAGVNLYLSDNFKSLPLEFLGLNYRPSPWQASDSLAILKYLSYQIDESWRLDDLRQRVFDKMGDPVFSELFDDNISASPAVASKSGFSSCRLTNIAGRPINRRYIDSAGVGLKTIDFSKVISRLPLGASSFSRLLQKSIYQCRQDAGAPGQNTRLAGCLTLNRESSRVKSTAMDVGPAYHDLIDRLSSLCGNSGPATNPQPTWGSNSWAVSGKSTEGGGALLVCDKHSALTCPDIWYLCSLSTPDFHCAGATIAGVPGIIVGRNENIAWGSSTLRADVQDLFLEQFDSTIPKQYKVARGWKNITSLTEEIGVRFGSNFLHNILITEHGPVLLRNSDMGIALSWTGSNATRSPLESIWKLNRAGNWQDFTAALQSLPGPCQIFTYGDRSGNVGYQAVGDIPIRNGKSQGMRILQGWMPDGQWNGSVAFTDLPGGYNPARSFVVAANQKVPAANNLRLIGHQWDAPYRAARINAVLNDYVSAKRKLNLRVMNELESDQEAHLHTLITQELKQAIAGNDLIDRIQLLALDSLEKWDGQLHPDSQAAAIYESFLRTFAERVVQAKLGTPMTNEYLQLWPMWPTLVERILEHKPAAWLPPEERNYSTFMLTTFSQSLKNLRLSFGNDNQSKWAWQSIHHARFSHVGSQELPWLSPLIDIGVSGLGGDQDTVNANSIASDSSQFSCNSGPTLRTLVDMSDADKFYQSICLGQSGQFFSPFRQDQLAAWLKVDPRPIAFSDSQLDRQTQYKLILTNR